MLKGKTPLVIAVALGVAAFLVAWSAIKRREQEVKQGWNLVNVLTANQDIPEGTVVTQDMVVQLQVPEQFVTTSVIKPESGTYVFNQKVLVRLQKGDPLLWSQFETAKAAERLSAKVQRRTRAVTIEASKKTSVGGWVRPNDHIDIIGTFAQQDSSEKFAVTLLQNVIVLATGKITGTTNVNLIPESQRDYNNVSVLVLPEEAEILVLASSLGELTLALRNEDDVDLLDERAFTNMKTLLTGERRKKLQQERQATITIIRGAGSDAAPTPANPK